jgi:putative phosphonate metabolism protein
MSMKIANADHRPADIPVSATKVSNVAVPDASGDIKTSEINNPTCDCSACTANRFLTIKETSVPMNPAPAFARYAVYWAPEDDDPLRAFGAAWFGHDPEPGAPLPRRERLGLTGDMADGLTAEPRRYGLHATLKAPFRLMPGASVDELVARMAAIAAASPAFTAPPLRLSRLHGFLALRPSGASTAIDAIARRCVIDLDPLRAPLDTAERARRNPDVLSSMQRENLDIWGYPYVLDEFGFHITLTGRLTDLEHARLQPLLETATAPFQAAPFAVRSIALFGDPGCGMPFRLVQRFALASA